MVLVVQSLYLAQRLHVTHFPHTLADHKCTLASLTSLIILYLCLTHTLYLEAL